MTTTIGPLTTTFTPPASCVSSASTLGWVNGAFAQQAPFETGNCYPSYYKPTNAAYYSPGICPSGYTAACSSAVSIGTVTQTVQTCCPTYGYDGQSMSFTCNKVIPFYSWMYSQVCTSAFPTTNATLVMVATTLGDSKSSTITTTTNQNGLNAFGVQIMFQSTDFQSQSTSGTNALTSAAETQAATATATQAGDNSNTSQGLTTGAALGIGIGCGILLFGIAGAVVLLLLRRRKKTNPVMMETPKPPPSDFYSSQTPQQYYPFEMSSKFRPYELGGSLYHTHELPGVHNASELSPSSQDPSRGI